MHTARFLIRLHLLLAVLFGCAHTPLRVSEYTPKVGPKPLARVDVIHPNRSIIDSNVQVSFLPDLGGNKAKLAPDKVLELLEDERFEAFAVAVLAMPGNPSAVQKQNDQLMAMVKDEPRLVPVASVHPLDGKAALLELERVKKLGAKMIKLHQSAQRFDLGDPTVAAVMSRAGKLDLPVVIDGTFTLDPLTMKKTLKLAITNPKTKIVMAHMGMANFREVLALSSVSDYRFWPRNVYFDISGTVSLLADAPDADMLVWTIRKLGVDRVMFGSDYPRVTPSEALASFDKLKFNAAERRALLQETAEHLLKQ